jgi:DnaJ-class molecular chaperone
MTTNNPTCLWGGECVYYAPETFETQRPWKCPVCDGTGRLDNAEQVHNEGGLKLSWECFPCKGTGIVWGP